MKTSRPPMAAGVEVQRRRAAGDPGAAEGGTQVVEAFELAVLREEHLHHGARQQPVGPDVASRRRERLQPRHGFRLFDRRRSLRVLLVHGDEGEYRRTTPM